MTKTALIAEPPSFNEVACSLPTVAAHCGAFLALLLVGIFGLQSERQGLSSLPHTEQLHTLFASLLCTTVLVRCLWSWKALTRAPERSRREFDRLTARAIYLLLYSLAGYQLVIDLTARTPLHMEHCQFFLGCGVAAVLLLRVCAVQQRRHGHYSSGTRDFEHYLH